MDTWTHRSMEMDAILHSSNLAPKTSFPQLPSFQNTAHVFPSTIHPQNLQIVLCRECVRERDKKHSAREKERGEREAQFNPVHSEFWPSAKSAAGIRDQTALYGATLPKRPLLLPPTLVRVPHAGPRTLFLLPLAVSANLIK